jgi:hypothetical protein
MNAGCSVCAVLYQHNLVAGLLAQVAVLLPHFGPPLTEALQGQLAEPHCGPTLRATVLFEVLR